MVKNRNFSVKNGFLLNFRRFFAIFLGVYSFGRVWMALGDTQRPFRAILVHFWGQNSQKLEKIAKKWKKLPKMEKIRFFSQFGQICFTKLDIFFDFFGIFMTLCSCVWSQRHLETIFGHFRATLVHFWVQIFKNR